MRVVALILSAALAVTPVEGASKRRIVGRHTPEPPYGVSLDTAAGSSLHAVNAIDAAAADGIHWVRVPFLWSVIQSTSGVFADLRFYGPIVARAQQDNVQLVGLLGFAAPWNTTAPAYVTDETRREHYPPADYDAWSRYVTFIVTTYKATVRAWEVWDQPDIGGPGDASHPCTGSWCGTPAQYAQLLAVAYKAIKAADPSATVVFGRLALPPDGSDGFIGSVVTDPANAAFDAIEFHAFGSKTDVQKSVFYVKTQLLYNGADLRPMWIDYGYPSDNAAQTVAPYFGGQSGQVAYVNDISPYILSLGAKKLFWYQFLDANPAFAAGDPFASYGLMAFDLTKKQAYDAFGNLIKNYQP